MTVDIRAAVAEAAQRYPTIGVDLPAINKSRRLRQKAFAAGAVWAQAQLTPTRDQLAKAIFMTDYEHMGTEAWVTARLDGNNDRDDAYTKADAVLALLQNT